MKRRKSKGSIEVIYGPMFSGKTTELLRRLRKEAQKGRHCHAFKPSIDSRYSTDEIVSHDGNRLSCSLVEYPKQLVMLVGSQIDVVGVDEAHFMNGHDLSVAVKVLAKNSRRIILAGLDTDYCRSPFDWIAKLGQQTQKTALTASCAICGEPARFSQRLDIRETLSKPLARLVIGGPETYEPRCGKCHRIPAISSLEESFTNGFQ